MGKLFISVSSRHEMQLIDGLTNFVIDIHGRAVPGLQVDGTAFRIDDMRILLNRVERMKLTVMGIDCFVADDNGLYDFHDVIVVEDFNDEGHENPAWFKNPFLDMVEEIKKLGRLDTALFDPTVSPIPPEWLVQYEADHGHPYKPFLSCVKHERCLNEKANHTARPFESNLDMLQCAGTLFDIRARILHEPSNEDVSRKEKEMTSEWHARYLCSVESSPLSSYMHKHKLNPVQRELLAALCLRELGLCDAWNCQEMAEYVTGGRSDYEIVLRSLAKNSPLYRKRIIYQHRMMNAVDPLWSRMIFISPDIAKNILGIKATSIYHAKILAETEQGMLRHLNKIAVMLVKRCHEVLGLQSNRNKVRFMAMMSYLHSFTTTLENRPEWALSQMFDQKGWREPAILIVLTAKHMGWIDSNNMACSMNGLAAVCAGVSGTISGVIGTYLDHLVGCGLIRSDDSVNNPKEQWYELHPDAIARFGLDKLKHRS